MDGERTRARRDTGGPRKPNLFHRSVTGCSRKKSDVPAGCCRGSREAQLREVQRPRGGQVDAGCNALTKLRAPPGGSACGRFGTKRESIGSRRVACPNMQGRDPIPGGSATRPDPPACVSRPGKHADDHVDGRAARSSQQRARVPWPKSRRSREAGRHGSRERNHRHRSAGARATLVS